MQAIFSIEGRQRLNVAHHIMIIIFPFKGWDWGGVNYGFDITIGCAEAAAAADRRDNNINDDDSERMRIKRHLN